MDVTFVLNFLWSSARLTLQSTSRRTDKKTEIFLDGGNVD